MDAGSTLSVGELGLLVLERLLLPLLLGLLCLGTLLLLEGVFTDGLVGLGVEVLETVGLNVVINVLLELGLVALLIVIGEGLHVLSDVAAEDVLLEGLGIKLLGLDIETGEAVLGVGNEDATVGGTLHDTENAGTGGGAGKTNIEEGLEGAALLTVDLSGLGEAELTIGLLNTGEGLIEAELLQDAASEEQTGGVGSSPVGEAMLDAIGAELVRVSGDEDLVAVDLSGDDLGDDVAVGEADNEPVLGGVVLVLGLGDQALASIVVGLARSSPLVLGLEATVKKSLSV